MSLRRAKLSRPTPGRPRRITCWARPITTREVLLRPRPFEYMQARSGAGYLPARTSTSTWGWPPPSWADRGRARGFPEGPRTGPRATSCSDDRAELPTRWAGWRRPIEYLLRALNKTEDTAIEKQARFLLGEIYLDRGEYSRRRSEYQAASSGCDPRRRMPTFTSGEIYARLNDPVKARAEWRKTLIIDPSHYGAQTAIL